MQKRHRMSFILSTVCPALGFLNFVRLGVTH
jgi:hypothetical protein